MAIDVLNLFNSFQGLTKIHQGADIAQQGAEAQAQAIMIGGEVAAQGAELSAAALRSSIKSLTDTAIFNIGISQQNEKRKIESISRQLQRAKGLQLSAQAKSGLSVTSKSFLQLQNEAFSSFEKRMLNTKIDAENSRRSQVFETQVRQTNLENQARAQEYRASAERTLSANRAAEASFQGDIAQFKAGQQTAKAIPTLLSQVFGQ
jgi:hypothetical protein